MFLYKNLPQDVFPNAVFPRIKINISSSYTPIDKMLFDITKPIEEEIKTVHGVNEIRSTTGVGNAVIDVFFSWETDPDKAYELTLANISRISSELPKNTLFDVKLMSPSAFSIANYSIVSETVPEEDLTNIAKYNVKPKILSVNGVYNVEFQGDKYKTFDIFLNPSVMFGYGLVFDDVFKAINSRIQTSFLGGVNSGGKNMITFFYSRPEDIKSILKIPVKTSENKTIFLGDIANVVNGSYPVLAMVKTNNYKSSVILNVFRDNQSNGVDVINDVDQVIDEISKKLPKEVSIIKWYDLTNFVSISVRSVIDAIVLGSVITLVVITIFLGRIRLALLTVFIIPVSILISIIVIYLLKGSINIMSLGGLAASIGAIVDHAIVVMENIEKNFTTEKSKAEIVIESSGDILTPMFFATVTSASVFIPLLFLSDVVGMFFKALAASVVSTLVISQLLAIVFTPLLAFMVVKKKHHKEPFWFGIFRKIYSSSLNIAIRFSFWVIPFALVLFAVIFFAYKNMATTFLPEWDEGAIVIDFVTTPGTSPEQTYGVVKHIEEIVKKIPEVENITLRIGAGIGEVAMPTNNGDFVLVLKNDRKRSTNEIIEEIEEEVNENIHSLQEFDVYQILGDRLGDLTGEHAPFEVIIYGNEEEKLLEIGEQLKEQIEKNPLFKEVNLKTSFYGPYIYITPKDNTYSDYGISDSDLANYSQLALWGIDSGNIIQGETPVTLRLKIPFSSNLTEFYKLPVWSPKLNTFVPLRDIAEIIFKDKIPEVNHKNLASMALITTRLNDNDFTKGARNLRSIINNFKVPEGYSTSLEGFYKSQQESFTQLEYIVSFSILIVLALLVLQFGSFLQGVSVLLGTLLSVTGVLLALLITGKPIDVTAFIGILLVISIVINNGILIFDYYNKFLTDEHDITQALIHACKQRMRPIIMTMAANALGFLPVAFAMGRGTEIIQPMAIAVMGGLIFSIILSLFFMPSFYILFKGRKNNLIDNIQEL